MRLFRFALEAVAFWLVVFEGIIEPNLPDHHFAEIDALQIIAGALVFQASVSLAKFEALRAMVEVLGEISEKLDRKPPTS